jgi:hypothetical protein
MKYEKFQIGDTLEIKNFRSNGADISGSFLVKQIMKYDKDIWITLESGKCVLQIKNEHLLECVK